MANRVLDIFRENAVEEEEGVEVVAF